ncbi:MAG: hypothetical protein ACRD3M_11935 [Thermoanaerobaculia bacterium]
MSGLVARTLFRATIVLALFSLNLPVAAAKLQTVDFAAVKAGVGPLFAAGPETIKVVVKDERPEPDVLYCTLGGMYGLFGGETPTKPEMVPAAMEEDAREAVEILGFKPGDGHTLEITVKDVRIDVPVRKNAFGAANFIGFARIDTALKGPDGAVLASKSFRLASWISMVEGKWPIPYMYARFLWEAVARTLLPQFPRDPSSEAVTAVLARLGTLKDDTERTNLITWLGLLGKPAPGVIEKLQQIFRTEEDQTLYETAALSLARLATPEVRDELLAVAARTKVLKEWDPGDAEEGWTLTYALHLMEIPDLKARAPRLTRDPERQTQLYSFLETGEPPRRPEKLERKLAEAREKLKK